ncbi:uncharacterized protein EI90DRAFT_3013432 [Cantharellus anzutake]|uniref:uncharacterized protein n=1 Tax=Cantharellus anzutake TaxID=1750568 RepID=UPI00190677EA|nr:uncharacterized protein EI90DRAFT_3013432 [Cantharellus anzutake]KAF8338122.1 hypothetical protein EI90DRAFT_3013432 [Cantharellus anzutake]
MSQNRVKGSPSYQGAHRHFGGTLELQNLLKSQDLWRIVRDGTKVDIDDAVHTSPRFNIGPADPATSHTSTVGLYAATRARGITQFTVMFRQDRHNLGDASHHSEPKHHWGRVTKLSLRIAGLMHVHASQNGVLRNWWPSPSSSTGSIPPIPTVALLGVNS